ncbi:M15 family metallopeptidase [Aneurinibacillus tyrosinisolvens]|uniref:M15 family metallopeptidase n=1 Tax=Aneurinibacillus tyrosinisolvens TaxID=1443435 RepID=UPI0009E23365
MRDNNTSAFNTRIIAGKKQLSNHSYGMGIDINPVQNPEIQGNKSQTDSEEVITVRLTLRNRLIPKETYSGEKVRDSPLPYSILLCQTVLVFIIFFCRWKLRSLI